MNGINIMDGITLTIRNKVYINIISGIKLCPSRRKETMLPPSHSDDLEIRFNLNNE